MSAINDYCRELEKLKSNYLQQLVDVHEEIFNTETRVNEIVNAMVELRLEMIKLLEQAPATWTPEWHVNMSTVEDNLLNCKTEVTEIGERQSELHFRVGAYGRLIKIIEDRISSCQKGL